MNSINFSMAVLAFEQLTAVEKETFMDSRLMWASTGAVRDEEMIRL